MAQAIAYVLLVVLQFFITFHVDFLVPHWNVVVVLSFCHNLSRPTNTTKKKTFLQKCGTRIHQNIARFFAILFLTFLCDIIDILTNFGLTKYIKSAKNVCNAVSLCWGYDTSMPNLKWCDLRLNGHVIILPVKLISMSQSISCYLTDLFSM